MNTVFECLATAAVMLTITCVLAALLMRRGGVVAPRLRQAVLFCVLLQGLMLYRMPIELPWLAARGDVEMLHSSPGALVSGESVLPPAIDLGAAESPVRAIVAASVIPTGGPPTTAIASIEERWSLTETLVALALSIWLAGFAVVTWLSLRRYVTLCRLIGQLSGAPRHWQTEWAGVCQRRVRKTPEMLISESAGPMLVRRPRGYAFVVPRGYWQSLSTTQRRGVMLHECAHLRRYDVWRQLIARLAAALHWWNPAAWWCIRRYEESAEWTCDESLTRDDPEAAKGLATSLVRLVEFVETFSDELVSAPDLPYRGGLGVQSMAAPPLTQRVTRLLKPSSSGDSVMKRLLLCVMAGGLLTLSAIQFRLVAATPDDPSAAVEEGDASESDLRVLSADSKAQLEALRGRLNEDDKATSDLKRLLESEAGRVAFAGMIELLQDRYREQARGEAIPRFVERHFESTDDDRLVLREESRETAESWVERSERLGEVVESIHHRLSRLAERLDDSSEVNTLAKRMLTDEHLGFAVMLDEFDGRSDPVELFLAERLEKILVQRGAKMVVVPTLGEEQQRQIKRFELASEVAERLARELPEFAEEFAAPDERHERLIEATKTPEMAAVIALHITDEGTLSASGAVDKLFEQIEEISRDTADGLVIEDEEAWQNLEEIRETAERARNRLAAVREPLRRIADKLDTSDPMTKRFADEIRSGVIVYQVAAEIPYADFDVGKQIEAMISQVMEPAGENRLRIRDESAAEVSKRAEEFLTACRTIRRYLRRVDTVRERMVDHELADALDGPGRMLLLSEIRNHAERAGVVTPDLLEKEFFLVDETSDQLTVHPQRVEMVGQLIERARELEAELDKDDF